METRVHVDHARVPEQRAQASSMVNRVAQRVPGGVTDLVRMQRRVVADHWTAPPGRWAIGIWVDPSQPAIDLVQQAQQLRVMSSVLVVHAGHGMAFNRYSLTNLPL
jgi:hypothetical protein